MNCPGAFARGERGKKDLALAENELPRRFSPGLARKKDLALAENELPRRFSPGLANKKFLALAETPLAFDRILAKALSWIGPLTLG